MKDMGNVTDRTAYKLYKALIPRHNQTTIRIVFGSPEQHSQGVAKPVHRLVDEVKVGSERSPLLVYT